MTDSLEEYLYTIYVLENKNKIVRVTDIANSMEVTKASTNNALNQLKEQGLINYEKYKNITITKNGEARAKYIERRHALFRIFLKDVIKTDETNAAPVVTDVSQLKQGIEKGVANAILIKPNQIGTLTETLETIRLAKKNNYKTITILRGDTLSQIAREYGVTVNELARINNIQNINLIYAGRTLRVPVSNSQENSNLEEIVYMKPSHDFFDYIKESDYGVQLSDTEGYSYFINECLQYGTPVICTNFPSVYESVENEKNGYILDMNLSNLDINKIINNIPKNFLYEEKCNEKDWIELLNKKVERKKKNMYKVIAKQDYTDKRPELIENYCNGKEIEFNEQGNAKIKKNDIYYVNDSARAMQIKKSGLAEVEEEIETATKKTKVETAIRKTKKKTK